MRDKIRNILDVIGFILIIITWLALIALATAFGVWLGYQIYSLIRKDFEMKDKKRPLKRPKTKIVLNVENDKKFVKQLSECSKKESFEKSVEEYFIDDFRF